MMMACLFTPPYAVLSAFASSIAGSKFYPTCFESMKLSVLVFLLPVAFIFCPALLMQDTTVLYFLYRFAVSLAAVFVLSVGFQGFLFKSISWWERVVWVLGGILLFVPQTYFLYLGGVVTGIAILIYFLNPARRITNKAAL